MHRRQHHFDTRKRHSGFFHSNHRTQHCGINTQHRIVWTTLTLDSDWSQDRSRESTNYQETTAHSIPGEDQTTLKFGQLKVSEGRGIFSTHKHLPMGMTREFLGTNKSCSPQRAIHASGAGTHTPSHCYSLRGGNSQGKAAHVADTGNTTALCGYRGSQLSRSSIPGDSGTLSKVAMGILGVHSRAHCVHGSLDTQGI